jgi:KDO2-lipid IV(A) lauroyltransferase
VSSLLKRNKIINLIEYILFRIGLFFLRILPYEWGKWFTVKLFIWIGYGFGIRRHLAETHLQKVYPAMTNKQRKALLRDIYRNMGLSSAELYLQKGKDLISSLDLKNKENLDRALALGRGVIIATAHLGNWEAATTLPVFGYPLSAVVKKQHNPYFDRYTNALRTRYGMQTINLKRGVKDIITHLKNNQIVALLCDQNAGKSGIILDFLGYPASHWKGPVKISLRYHIPIVPAFAVRSTNSKIQICFEPMIFYPELVDNEEGYIFLWKQLNQVIESYINRYPEQWFWVHNRWKATGAMKENRSRMET